MANLAYERKAIINEYHSIKAKQHQLWTASRKMLQEIQWKFNENCALFHNTRIIKCVDCNCFNLEGNYSIDRDIFDCVNSSYRLDMDDDGREEEDYPTCEMCGIEEEAIYYCGCENQYLCDGCIFCKVHKMSFATFSNYPMESRFQAYFDANVYSYNTINDCKPMVDYLAMLKKDNAFFKEAIATKTKYDYDHNGYGKTHPENFQGNTFYDYSALKEKCYQDNKTILRRSERIASQTKK